MLGRVCTRGRVCTSGNFDRLLDLIYYKYLNLKGDIGHFDISMQIRSTLWYIRNIVTFLNCPNFDHKRHSKIFDKFRNGKVPWRFECVTCRLMADAELLDNNIVTGKKNLVYSWFLYVYFVRQYVTKLRCPITTESWTLFIKEI